MKFITFIAIGFLVALLAVHETALGHGFELSLNGNQIAAVSEVPTISPHLFVEEFDSFSATELFTDHGGVEAGGDGSIQLPGDTLGVEFLGPMWYSSGGVAQRSGTGLTLNATSYDTSITPNTILGSVNLTGSTTNPGSFPVVGDDDHSIGWILSGTSIPAGAYGFSYRVTGLKDGDAETPFQPSVPLVVVFSTPGFNGSPAGSLGNATTGDFQRHFARRFRFEWKAERGRHSRDAGRTVRSAQLPNRHGRAGCRFIGHRRSRPFGRYQQRRSAIAVNAARQRQSIAARGARTVVDLDCHFGDRGAAASTVATVVWLWLN